MNSANALILIDRLYDIRLRRDLPCPTTRECIQRVVELLPEDKGRDTTGLPRGGPGAEE